MLKNMTELNELTGHFKKITVPAANFSNPFLPIIGSANKLCEKVSGMNYIIQEMVDSMKNLCKEVNRLDYFILGK
ncbi:MAG: hypothetical protein LBH43_15200 [Treponema sp.]|jgi:hypothetical protein|nr:hypothetical protein [Treponema sp.]